MRMRTSKISEQFTRFENTPSFNEVVHQVRLILDVVVDACQYEVMIRGRFDAGENRAHYVLMPIKSKDDWNFNKDIVKGSLVNCLVVVFDTSSRVEGHSVMVQGSKLTLEQWHLDRLEKCKWKGC
jgi:hypothetical protein